MVLGFRGMDSVIAGLSQSVPFLQQTIMLAGCGHWTQQERPQAVNDQLLTWLRGLRRVYEYTP